MPAKAKKEAKKKSTTKQVKLDESSQEIDVDKVCTKSTAISTRPARRKVVQIQSEDFVEDSEALQKIISGLDKEEPMQINTTADQEYNQNEVAFSDSESE